MKEPICGNCKNYRPCTEEEILVLRKATETEDCERPLGVCRGDLPKLTMQGNPFGKSPVVYYDEWCAQHNRRRNSSSSKPTTTLEEFRRG